MSQFAGPAAAPPRRPSSPRRFASQSEALGVRAGGGGPAPRHPQTETAPNLSLKRLSHWATVALIVTCAVGCASLPRYETATRDLPAFVQVDEGLYRGGQPTPEGFLALSRLGIKTVISLRQSSAAMREEQRQVEQLGMRWVSIPMWFWWRPSEAQIRQFLSIAIDPASRPVFVHCRQGRNRAGILAAVYRMVHDHWSADQAYAEGRRYGLVWWNIMSRQLLFDTIPKRFASSPILAQPDGASPGP